MTRVDFIKKVSKDTGAPMTQTEPWVNAVLDSLADALITEDEVKLRNLGKFEHVRRKPRTGRNASTGEPIPIPAWTDVKFTVSEKIAEEIRDVPVPEKD